MDCRVQIWARLQWPSHSLHTVIVNWWLVSTVKTAVQCCSTHTLQLKGMLLTKYDFLDEYLWLHCSAYHVAYIPPLISGAVPTQWMFHRWNGSLPPLSSLFLLHCYYLLMSVFHSLPPTYTLHQYLSANQSVAFQMSAVTQHSSRSLSQSQCSLISVPPSAKSFDIQGSLG